MGKLDQRTPSHLNEGGMETASLQQMSMLDTVSPQKMTTIDPVSTQKKGKGATQASKEKEKKIKTVPEDPIEDSYDRLIQQKA